METYSLMQRKKTVPPWRGWVPPPALSGPHRVALSPCHALAWARSRVRPSTPKVCWAIRDQQGNKPWDQRAARWALPDIIWPWNPLKMYSKFWDICRSSGVIICARVTVEIKNSPKDKFVAAKFTSFPKHSKQNFYNHNIEKPDIFKDPVSEWQQDKTTLNNTH